MESGELQSYLKYKLKGLYSEPYDKLSINTKKVTDNLSRVEVFVEPSSIAVNAETLLIQFKWDFRKDRVIQWVELKTKVRDFVKVNGDKWVSENKLK